MSDERWGELRGLLRDASRGPWVDRSDGTTIRDANGRKVGWTNTVDSPKQAVDNQQAIVALRNQAEALLAELAAAEGWRSRPAQYLECPCCGCEGAYGPLYTDGQKPSCGCAGRVSVDGEMETAYINADDCECGGEGPLGAMAAHRLRQEAEGWREERARLREVLEMCIQRIANGGPSEATLGVLDKARAALAERPQPGAVEHRRPGVPAGCGPAEADWWSKYGDMDNPPWDLLGKAAARDHQAEIAAPDAALAGGAL